MGWSVVSKIRRSGITDVSGGNPERATIYLGGDAEIDDQGTWTKYVHDDAKRVGNAGAAQKFLHHRDHLKSIKVITNSSGAEVKRTILTRPTAAMPS